MSRFIADSYSISHVAPPPWFVGVYTSPGIPPANPAATSVSNQGQTAAAACAMQIGASSAPVAIPVDSSVGFSIGATAIVDTAESTIQEFQPITDIPNATHVTVKQLDHSHDGTTTPFPELQAGEKGLLIAEWYEYTPSSGTDFAVTSDLTTIA